MVTMRYTRLGRTGLTVSRLCLGTVNFGGRVEETEAHELMDRALAAGINFVDTADTYGWRVRKGYAEELIGRWLSTRRSDVVLATKVGDPMSERLNDSGLSVWRTIRRPSSRWHISTSTSMRPPATCSR
jgi:NDP-hexose 2,3-enoyl reductase